MGWGGGQSKGRNNTEDDQRRNRAGLISRARRGGKRARHTPTPKSAPVEVAHDDELVEAHAGRGLVDRLHAARDLDAGAEGAVVLPGEELEESVVVEAAERGAAVAEGEAQLGLDLQELAQPLPVARLLLGWGEERSSG